MGFLDRLFGRDREPERAPQPPSADQQAVERYRYLLRTAPPEAIERVHAEAFAQLTPEQRQQVLNELSSQVPEYERGGATTDPRNLARMATRAEVRQPGTLERTFGRMGGPAGGGGPSFGGMFASSLLGSIAGYVVGSAIANQFFADHDPGFEHEAAASESAQDSGGDFDQGGDFGGDVGGGFDVSDV